MILLSELALDDIYSITIFIAICMKIIEPEACLECLEVFHVTLPYANTVKNLKLYKQLP